MTVRTNPEMSGFKLLEEDTMEDRPCAAVKKYVASVLDRPNMKDQEVAASYRNLMEYRDSASSPSACSVATSSSILDGDRLNSPPSPSSPTTVTGPVDDQRLPNELLDEICEDIGMKDDTELDFVEFIMEQDTNPHMYMTPEAISSGAFTSAPGSTISTPTGSASGSSNTGSDNKTLTVLYPAVTTTPNFLYKQNLTESDWLHPLPMSVNHSSSSNSSESTTVKSAENHSPANKRVHLSISTDTSPGKGQPQLLHGYNQYNYGAGIHNSGYHNFFKIPQPGPPMAKRSHSYPIGTPTSSPVQSSHSSSSQGSNASFHTNCHPPFSRPHEFSTNPPSCHPGNSSDAEDSVSGNNNNSSNTTTNNNSSNNNKNNCVSPKPLAAVALSRDFAKPSSPSQAGFGSQPGQVGARDGSVFQRVEKQQHPAAPHISSGKPLQQYHHNQHRWVNSPQGPGTHNTPASYFNKGIYPAGLYANHHLPVNHSMGCHMPPGQHNTQIRTPVDSPLDQGYFSNESAGNCSNSSAPSPAFTTSSISSFSSMIPAEHSQKFSQKSALAQQQVSGAPGSRPSGQKSVHFADMPDGSPPAYAQSPGNTSVDMKPSFNSENGVPSDCAFEMESNGQPKLMPSGKILPRFNHNMKSGVAPYTVPNSQGQVMVPDVSQGYDLNTRPSCAMTNPGERLSPGDNLQTFPTKPSQINGNNGGGAFYVDGNQNMMRVDSMHEYPPFPPPLISPQSGEYVGVHPDQHRYGMEQFNSLQQQQPHSQHPPHPLSSSADSMPPLQPHPQMQSMQQHHHHQQQPPPHLYSSCSHSSQGIDHEFTNPHQSNMQITNNSGGYHMPLAMSTPVSNRPGPNSRLGGAYGNQGCPPAYEGSYVQPGMYPSQQPHGQPPSNQIILANQQSSSVHSGWGSPDDLRSQGHANSVPMKEGLQAPHGHPHLQPSPVPGAPIGLGPMQDGSIMNPGNGPHHPHMDPHPEYGPCAGLPCAACKMTHNPPQPHQHMGPCSGPNCHTCKMNHQNSGSLPPHMGPCAGPGCPACKMNQATRPQMLSSQQKFIQHLIMDEGNAAYRSHPLFPLLRDLVIAEMNFDNPNFHYQQLLSLLPNDFHKLLQNFLHRNPPSGHYQSNQAVESVIMDSLRLAHSNLVDKIRHRQEMEKMKANSSASLRSMEEFCQKFDHSVSGPMGRPMPNGMGAVTYGNHMSGYHEGGYIQHGGVGHLYRPMKDSPDMFGDSTMSSTSPQSSKTESKKHPSLPKEAVAMMMEWLRNHKDNPYPNDDEKAMLIKQTGLSINQVNYWFTNARRRILPKWSQCKT